MNKIFQLIVLLIVLSIIPVIIIGCPQKNEFTISVDISSKEIFEEGFRYYVYVNGKKTEIVFSHKSMKIFGINRVSQNESGKAAFSVSVESGKTAFSVLAPDRVDFYILIVSGGKIASYKMPDSPYFEWINERILSVKLRDGKTRYIISPF